MPDTRDNKNVSEDDRIVETLDGTVVSTVEVSAERGDGQCPQTLIDVNREFIKNICDSFNVSSENYNPETSMQIVLGYLYSDKRLPRVLYSEISANMFQLQTESKDNNPILTNIDLFIEKTLDDSLFDSSSKWKSLADDDKNEVKEFVLRIFDHIHLADLQIHQIKEARNSSLEAKKKTEDYEKTVGILTGKLDKAQREYITVLGIFATVVVAFMGGMTFSSSVLQTMQAVTVYRLTGVILLLGFVLFNLLNMLMKFLLVVTDVIRFESIGKGMFSLRAWHWSGWTYVEKVNFIFSVLFVGNFLFWLVHGSNLRLHLSRALNAWLFLDEGGTLSCRHIIALSCIVLVIVGGVGLAYFKVRKSKSCQDRPDAIKRNVHTDSKD